LRLGVSERDQGVTERRREKPCGELKNQELVEKEIQNGIHEFNPERQKRVRKNTCSRVFDEEESYNKGYLCERGLVLKSD